MVSENMNIRTITVVTLCTVLTIGCTGIAASTGVVPTNQFTASDEFETEVSWKEHPPSSVGAGESFYVSVTGHVNADAELCLYEERSDSTNEIECRNLDGAMAFTYGFEIDAEEDLEASSGEHAPLYVTVEEDGWFGDSDSTITVSTYVEESG